MCRLLGPLQIGRAAPGKVMLLYYESTRASTRESTKGILERYLLIFLEVPGGLSGP